ncbi:MAG TPA: histidinol-phosphate transaminase [Pusillimonas sp.]|nr:histidinol-phosphate transaminase [Pusillimonas sp.]
MSCFWSDHVSGLSPYVPGEQPQVVDLLKLNTNEHPWGPSPKALAAIKEAATDRLRLYPDPQATALREVLARHHGVTPNCIFVGNGSDEVLAHVFNALFRRQGRSLWMPDITYSFYRSYCTLFGITPRLIPLADDLSISASDYLSHTDEDLPAGIIFANPNAPTGRALSLQEIADIARANPRIPVVVDEAYVDFGAESSIALLEQHDNIVAIHTFSKSRALAGLRVGYAVANPSIVEGLVRVKDSFNSYPLDSLALAGAIAAVQDDDYFRRSCDAVIQARRVLARNLEALGFRVLPSTANFVFATHSQHDAASLFAALRAQRILVRHFSLDRIQQYLRISVGTPADNERLCQALKTIITTSSSSSA